MLEILKSWITTMLCTGIFFTFVKMIIPNSKLAKYIYSIIGVATVFTLIMPMAKFINTDNFENETKSVINSIENSSNVNTINIDNIDVQNTMEQNVKNEFSKKLKNEILKILEENNIKANMVSVIIDENYQIQKINIKIDNSAENKMQNIEKIFNLIDKNYNISNDKVIIEEE